MFSLRIALSFGTLTLVIRALMVPLVDETAAATTDPTVQQSLHFGHADRFHIYARGPL
jgi:hypothetical protein